TDNTRLNWTLKTADGVTVAQRHFTSDADGWSASSGSPLLDLLTGDYVLTVDGGNSTTGDFQFRLLDVSQGTNLTTGRSVSSQLIPANETDVYRFSAQAGDRYFFDVTSQSDGFHWQLLSPTGKVIFSQGVYDTRESDIDVTVLPESGTYTLLIEGPLSFV